MLTNRRAWFAAFSALPARWFECRMSRSYVGDSSRATSASSARRQPLQKRSMFSALRHQSGVPRDRRGHPAPASLPRRRPGAIGPGSGSGPALERAHGYSPSVHVSTVGSQKSMDPINWVIPLYDVPCDFDERSALFTEIHVEREPSGSCRLHSPRFKGTIAADIKAIAKELIDNINKSLGDWPITMGIPVGIRADGVQVTLVTAGSSTPIEKSNCHDLPTINADGVSDEPCP